MSIDRHHLLFTRTSWSVTPPGRQLRETPSLLVPMQRSQHNEIHAYCPAVPVPSYQVLARVASRMVVTHNTLEQIDNFMFATQEALRHPKAHEVERALGTLTIQALEEQRPFIRAVLGKNAA